jgi:DNA-binding MarR family transcriptional regulator
MPSNGKVPWDRGRPARIAESKKKAGETPAVPGGDHKHLNLDAFVPYRLSVLTNRVSNAIARSYSERFDLSVAEWRVMAVLGQVSGLSAGEVVRRTEMDKVQVSRAVAGLARRRRVQKQPDSSDGRVTRLALTSRGRAIYDEIVPRALELEEQFLAGLAPDERITFNELIEKLSLESCRLHAAKNGSRRDAEPLRQIKNCHGPRKRATQLVPHRRVIRARTRA